MPRTKGFIVTAKLFVPADMKDAKSARRVLDAVDTATTKRDISSLLESGQVIDVQAKYSSREQEQSTQTDIEDRLGSEQGLPEGEVVGDPPPAGSPASRRQRQAA